VSKGLLFKFEITVENSDLPVVMYPDIAKSLHPKVLHLFLKIQPSKKTLSVIDSLLLCITIFTSILTTPSKRIRSVKSKASNMFL
jgi:hypothetical protein